MNDLDWKNEFVQAIGRLPVVQDLEKCSRKVADLGMEGKLLIPTQKAPLAKSIAYKSSELASFKERQVMESCLYSWNP